jgi:hypothetical protein
VLVSAFSTPDIPGCQDVFAIGSGLCLVVRKYSGLRRIKHLARWPLTCYVGA